jgi:hypothetical protein
MVEAVRVEALTRKQLPNLESRIAARVGFHNAEPQSCRGIFCEGLVTVLKPVFAGVLSKRTPIACWVRCRAERTFLVSSRQFAFRPKEVHDR